MNKYNYFSYDVNEALHISEDEKKLVRKETGMSPLELIQSKLIDIDKEWIFDMDKFIAEIGYVLGFKYPQHFTHLFKRVGVSQREYRSLN
jgi:AraC-like DNA-binding protein